MAAICITNIGELITFSPLARQKRTSGLSDQDFGRHRQAWLSIQNGKVSAFGSGTPPPSPDPVPGAAELEIVDARGSLVMPGLIDSHTHPLFGGSRANEFCQRLNGASYQDIAAAGGGIQSTVRATRAASDAELLTALQRQMQKNLARGITTQEVKSGYGLSCAEELRHLRLFQTLRGQIPQDLSVTCLALHASSPETPQDDEYIELCRRELLPAVVADGLAEWVDAFIEQGYFSVMQLEAYIAEAQGLGLGVRLHADEFSDAGAARAAARWQAASADHLQSADPAAFAAMAEAGTVATLLPGTSLYTGIPYTQAQPLRDAGVAMALATDYNPGSCMIDNLAMIATLGALHCHLTPVEAVAAVTFVAAHALRKSDAKGALAVGYDADLLVYDLPSIEDWLWQMGRIDPQAVWIRGRRVL